MSTFYVRSLRSDAESLKKRAHSIGFPFEGILFDEIEDDIGGPSNQGTVL
jgi:hypothetical protein